ncbi:MAG TPA: hypothetical protein VN366_09205 [Feifaniaceae bacterium]|nr:hypothetical protein [Feifaniaceae bacterium]
MLDAFTPHLLYGLIGGLVASLILFRFFNLPLRLKNRFRLNTRGKMVLFIVLTGFAVAVLVTALVGLIGFPADAGQVIEGIGIGFSCAVVIGVLNASHAEDTKRTSGSGTKTARRQPDADNRGRRSKG